MEPPPRKKITVKSNSGQSGYISSHVLPSSRSQFTSGVHVVDLSPRTSPIPRIKAKTSVPNTSIPSSAQYKATITSRPDAPFNRSPTANTTTSMGRPTPRGSPTLPHSSKRSHVRLMPVHPDNNTHRIAPIDISHELNASPNGINRNAVYNRPPSYSSTRVEDKNDDGHPPSCDCTKCTPRSTFYLPPTPAHSDTGSLSPRVSALSVSSSTSVQSSPVRRLPGSPSSINNVDFLARGIGWRDIKNSNHRIEYSLDSHPFESQGFLVSGETSYARPCTPATECSVKSSFSDGAELNAKSEQLGQLPTEKSNINVVVEDESGTFLTGKGRRENIEAGQLGLDSDIEAEAKTTRKIEDLEITNCSLLAINASLELTHRRQAKEIRDLRKRLEERTIALSRGAPHDLDAGEGDQQGGVQHNNDDGDDETRDPAYERLKTMLESLIESGYRALETKPDQATEGGTRVLNLEEVGLFGSSSL